MSGDQRIAKAYIGEAIEAVVKIVARGGPVSGKLTVNIKKDIPLGTDVVYVSQTFDINLAENQAVQVGLVWSPDQASGSQLRGYFIEVLFDGEKIWTMPNNYPPRLTVEAMKTGYIRVIDAFWVKNGIRIISAELGDRVEAHVVVKAFNGQFYGGVKIKIKKDIPLAPDEDFAEADFNIILEEGQETDLTVVFRPDEPSSSRLRGYFIEVLVGGQGTWTMVDDYPPQAYCCKAWSRHPCSHRCFLDQGWC